MTLLSELSQELEALVAKTAPAVVNVEHRRGQGSGLVLAQDGYILTNSHVIQGSGGIGIGLSDGKQLPAQVVGRDRPTDLALLRVDASGLTSLPLAESRRVKVGQLVVAIGNPLRFERSVSLGVVSALDRSLPGPGGHQFEGLIQTDAAINPGNSGGPLVDATGTVVGINTAIIPFAQGIGFAVPAYTATWVAAVLITRGEIRRPVLGIAASGVDLPLELAQEFGQPRAVRVFQVGKGTPAEQAGIKEGELLLSANGAPLSSIDDLQRVMVFSENGTVRLETAADTRRREVEVRPRAMAMAG